MDKRLALLAMTLAIVGCATPTAGSYTPIPKERILIAATAFATSATGPVEIRRHPGLIGGALSVTLAIDGIDALVIDSGESTTLKLPAGERRLSVRWSTDIESFSTVRIFVKELMPIRVGINIIPSPAMFGKAQPAISEQ
jgi:hypothetical protein